MNSISILCGILTSIAHSFSSSGLFLFIGLLINKTYSRYLDSLFFIDQITRLLLLFFILGNLSFAVSLNFVGEIYALIGLFSIDSL
jgi:NADH:ubiquinone oxidoreductase subunit 4 (subunit M)